MKRRTHSLLGYDFSRNRKDGKNLGHDLPKQLGEFIREWDPSISVQTLKEEVDALEEVNQCLVVCRDISHCLRI